MKSRILFLSSACALLIMSGIASAHEKIATHSHQPSASAADWTANVSDDDLDSAALDQLMRSPDYPNVLRIGNASESELKADEKHLAKVRAWAENVRPDRVRHSYLHWINNAQGQINERRAEIVLNAHIGDVGRHIQHPPEGK